MHKLNDAQRKLVEENLKLVQHTIKRYIGSQYVFDDDLVSIGYIGLCRAATLYDETTKVPFSSYAVRGILLMLKQEYRSRFAQRRKANTCAISLDIPVNEEDEGSETFLYYVADEKANTEEAVMRDILIEEIKMIAPTVYKRCEEGMTYAEIAAEQKVSAQTVACTIRREQRKLRALKKQ